jgi:hypothetical protein
MIDGGLKKQAAFLRPINLWPSARGLRDQNQEESYTNRPIRFNSELERLGLPLPVMYVVNLTFSET